MLSIAAVGRLRSTVAVSTARGVSRLGMAAYQTHAPRSQHLGGRGKWLSRLLAFVRNRLGTPSPTSLAKLSQPKTAAGRLWAVIGARFSAAARPSTAWIGGRGYARSVTQRLVDQLRAGGSRARAGRWAFERGGRWSPYMKTVASAFRGSSSRGATSSAQMVMAHLRRQAAAGILTQQRKDLAIALPYSSKAQASLLSGSESARNRSATTAAATLASRGREPEGMPAAPTRAAGGQANAPLHPAALAAQDMAIDPDQCATITIPYVIPAGQLSDAGNASSAADVAQLLASIQAAQSRHTLLLQRLVERLSATGWNIHYRQIKSPVESLEVAISPDSGIMAARELETLLLDWGFDTTTFAVVLGDPRTPPAGFPPVPLRSAATEPLAASSELTDLDPRLFSLIVDEVVDPEEAYCEQVRDFLAELERLPQIRAGPSHHHHHACYTL